jgi:hypothetical protein
MHCNGALCGEAVAVAGDNVTEQTDFNDSASAWAAMMAVKHPGNAGSHPGKVDDEAVFDGFDILSYILDERYANAHNAIAALSKAINKSKGQYPNKRSAAATTEDIGR